MQVDIPTVGFGPGNETLAHTSQERISLAQMEEALAAIESGEFARQWEAEAKSGQKRFKELLERERSHAIEDAGKRVRSLMNYLREED